ncbi:putative non-ribosomal peptide synthetase [Gordonia effusa NBRC 100432]|uniref:Putative non-ribosomal peptide synthetase n=1 Tax=Gordonia effusa NBRC 100432 TaxID=1077974 RepID=H0QXQ5_9ACTN|nr:condensation domain-containing protein [Gordonia effusa]GAB17606.1 putative non-ribosomal peptide synthetase [Gordonia effusa NBRC 100432]
MTKTPEQQHAPAQPTERPLPLSLPQMAALMAHRRGNAINLFVALDLDGALDVASLEAATIQLVSRHEVLRGVYPDDRRRPYQRIVAAPDRVLEIIEDDRDESALLGALIDDATYGFDLGSELPIRIRLHRLSGRDVLSVAVHPVAADDAALDLIVAELFADDVVGVPSQYRDYAAAQLKKVAATSASDPDRSYWTDHLREPAGHVPIVEVPAGSGPARRTVTIPIATIAALSPEQENTEDAAAAVAVALAAVALRDAGLGDDVVIGLVDDARVDQATAGLVGTVANRLPLRSRVTVQSPRALIADAAQLISAARGHSEVRIEQTRQAMASERLYQAQLSVRQTPRTTVGGAGITARESVRQRAQDEGVDIAIDVELDYSGATIVVSFPPRLAGRPEIDAFAAGIGQRASAWAGDLDGNIAAGGVGVTLFSGDSGGLTQLSGLGGPPVSESERVVVQSIRDVLELDDDDEIGREDTFFSLGGDSIAALKMVTDLTARGYVIDVQTVFISPAVHELATALDSGSGSAEHADGASDSPVQSAPMSASGLDASTLAALGAKFGGGQ